MVKNQINGDLGNQPVVVNIDKETKCNNNYRKSIWTGEHLQVTVMSIIPGGEIGLELHENLDQFLRVEYAVASVYMGKTKPDVKFFGNANDNYAIIIPAGTWHNIINEQNIPLKMYSVYAPPKHPIGTVHKTKFEADLAED